MNRWRQYSLRTFLLTVTVLSAALGWIAAERSRSARANAAAKFFQERETFLTAGTPYSPRTGLAKQILGENLAAHYTDLQLNFSSIVDDDLRLLQDLPNLKFVVLNEKTTARGLRHLRGHPGIETLWIESQITDDDLALLRSLPRLRKLYLWRMPITGAGFAQLRGLPLKEINICQCPIQDEHLRHLQALPALEKIDLVGTLVTDEGLVHLQSIRSLREAYFALCPVTAAGAKSLLRANPQLKVIDSTVQGDFPQF